MKAIAIKYSRKIKKAAHCMRTLSIAEFFEIVAGALRTALYLVAYRAYHRKNSEFYRPLESPESSLSNPVTIMIPFRDGVSMLKKCIESIRNRTDYEEYTIMLIDNQSSLPETTEYLSSLSSDPKVMIVKYDKPFNYSALHNWAVGMVKTEIILLLNNDTEVITPGWLRSLVVWIVKSDIGAAGALLLYPDGKVQHAGVGFIPSSPYHLYEGHDPNGHDRNRIRQVQEVRAVTAACMITKKSLWLKVGGMDGDHLAVAYNDIDYCLKLREQGYRIIYEPKAELYHYESFSRGRAHGDIKKFRRNQEELSFFWKKWQRAKVAGYTEPIFDVRKHLINLLAHLGYGSK